MQNSLEVFVFAPKTLKKYFKELKKSDDENLNINSISIWIIENSLIIVKELLKELELRIEEKRIIPEDKAIYTFKGKNAT